jgi:ribosomal protein S18 acetylase RimI-like enzyme
MVEIRQADPRRIARIAEVLGRALVTEPMLTWPLGGRSDDLEERCIRAYALYIGPLLDEGLVWETADGHGALVLVPPAQSGVWDEALTQVDDSTTRDVTDDGGRRHERFYGWVASRIPPEPLWHLDSVAVEPGWQGRGIGSALVAFGLQQTRDSNTAVILETGTARNVPLYERHGFHVVEEADSPEGGPHVWFMRREPAD